METTTGQVTSTDGTAIAFERMGDGPPLVLVVGAFNDRSTAAGLASELSSDFTTFIYDRRGRGDSGDAAAFAVDREIEDLRALIGEAGGVAAVFGYSSGAILALRAASVGSGIDGVVLYDLPLMVDHGGPRWTVDHEARLGELIRAGRRGEAVEYFQANLVGLPEPMIVQVRDAPFRRALEAVAHTLVYDAALLGDGIFRPDLAAGYRGRLLAMAGETATPFMQETVRAVAEAMEGGTSMVLPGQGHDIDPAAVAPVIRDFLLTAA